MALLSLQSDAVSGKPLRSLRALSHPLMRETLRRRRLVHHKSMIANHSSWNATLRATETHPGRQTERSEAAETADAPEVEQDSATRPIRQRSPHAYRTSDA